MSAKPAGRKRFLLICNDVIGKQMAGPAIRCVEMASALSSQHEVTLVAPSISDRSFAGFSLLPATKESVRQQADLADVVVIQGDGLVKYPFLKETKAVLIADLYCPIPLEYHQSSGAVPPGARMNMITHLSRLLADQLCWADHFLCASEKQRDFWLGALTVAARVNGLRWPEARYANVDKLISVVPFGMPSQAPVKNGPGLKARFGIPDEDFVAIWGGGIYEWFDPLTVIRAIHRLVADGQKVHLIFMGVRHPNPAVEQHDMCSEAVRLADELGVKDRYVHFNFDWVDYESRQDCLLEADVGVTAHFDNPETRFSFRTRVLDYLWCGLPIISTKGDTFADGIEREQLGIAVEFEHVDGWVQALTRLKDDEAFRQRCAQEVGRYAARYTWPFIMGNFIRNLEGVGPAEDRDSIRSVASSQTQPRRIISRLRQTYADGGLSALFRLIVRRAARIHS